MKDLNTILTESTQSHEYRLKFAFEPTNKCVEKLQRVLSKYDLVSFGPVKKTIFQSKPLDFYELDCGEIYMIDVETSRAVSQNIMLYDITSCLKVSEALVRVRGKNEPVQQPMEEQEDDIKFDEYITKLTDTNYSDAVDIDVNELMGDALADEVAKQTLDQYNNERQPWAEFMDASFNHYYPKAPSDVVKDSGPTKE
ncbi:hypothetical protein NVP2275O_386 [Vibrio phage 2.275.O._10N.286.54.E11]|nr:hypothetical protein NVP2275O_386 [Vibrio phage 2.275.O._10N.286.54.E11]